ncbi:PspC domain-containing protein [Natribacillus halophilus]|uniref:Phage shock protein C (PspC) family protein n=1 Tax=Natribacillus halophilus TaxID=549003 RepID=A0A1G8KMC7_9BACI|nr:PspC domain-containing protein [Natribacillus halophilus]SDI44558.1 phage shock protein C (PspC) family protein [Natribacillus halophilus]
MKKLVRSSRNRIITGVCGGIGKHFNIDPIIIRTIAVISLFISMGVTVLVYLVLTMLVPSEGDFKS